MSTQLRAELDRILERLLDVKARGYRLAQLGAIAEDLERLLARDDGPTVH